MSNQSQILEALEIAFDYIDRDDNADPTVLKIVGDAILKLRGES